MSQEQAPRNLLRVAIFYIRAKGAWDGNQEGIPKFDFGGQGQRPPGVCYRSWRHSRSNPERRSGVLVPEGDHEKLAACASRCSARSRVPFAIALNGAEIVRKNFHLRAQAQRLEEIYLRAVRG